MPDVDGDNIGARKGKTSASLRWSPADAVRPLPNHLRVRLGETMRLGDLEVTPKSVKRQKVGVFVEGFGQPEPCPNDSLVLTLEMRNLSDEYAFTPLDNYFDRYWNGKGDSAPLTVLLAGKQKFFGGPAKWYPLKRDRAKAQLREWVDLPGRKNVDGIGLEPGSSATMAVCTDGANGQVIDYLFGRTPPTGDLLWRIQVRRGVVVVNGHKKSAAAVIGVEFTVKDIH
jgi:hypothetical protein